VLLLDPEGSLAELLAGLLAEWSYRCIVARDEEEALFLLRSTRIDVLVISEPSIEGARILERLLGSQLLPGRPILLSADEARVALDGPRIRVLLKPSELDLILFEVSAAASLARSLPAAIRL
jgi:DNA-binding response OmpR family regulator